jgi:hypothetical protein
MQPDFLRQSALETAAAGAAPSGNGFAAGFAQESSMHDLPPVAKFGAS